MQPPLPCTFTVSGKLVGVNFAVTLSAWSMNTLQLPEPSQAPLHPPKTYPSEGEAVRVTRVLLVYDLLQELPEQLMSVVEGVVYEWIVPPLAWTPAVRRRLTLTLPGSQRSPMPLWSLSSWS